MSETTYLNFDLEIEKADGGYRAHVLSSPAGEARAVMGPLPAPGGADSAAAGSNAAPQVVGGALFDAVFRGDILSCLRRSWDAAQRGGKGLRIRLRLSETPELAALPWELLYDRDSANFLALSRETPLVRYLDLPEPAESIEPELKLRVLAVIASPSDYPALDVEREWQNLKGGLAELESRGVVTVDRLQPPTVDALQKQLLKHEYHILHFLGHGDFSAEGNDGVLLLTAADGTGEAVTGETFSALLRDQKTLRLALINACRGAVSGDKDPYSGVAQRLVRGGVPAVIAMRSAISDEAAVALAHSFYSALAAGAAVDAALAEARKALYAGGFPNDWATAVLYMRAADGHLWRPNVEAAKRKRLRLALAAAGGAVALALLAVAVWLLAVPAAMPAANTMNIAVLDPGVVTANGAVEPSDEADLVRSWMAAPLKTPAALAQPRYAVWDNGLGWTQKRTGLPVLQDKTEVEREKRAGELAHAINAHVIVSGVIRQVDGQRELLPEVFVFSPLKGEAQETLGYYTLGGPIPLAADLRQDSLNAEFVARELGSRIELLNTALLALREDTLGKHDAALKLLEAYAAARGLPVATADGALLGDAPTADGAPSTRADLSSETGSALDVLYYFLAREKLFLHEYPAAEADARQAVALNGENVRAHIVLGGALLRQSALTIPQLALMPGGWQDGAEAEYDQAVKLSLAAHQQASAKGIKNSPIHAIAQLGQGDAWVTRAEKLLFLRTPEANQEADGWLKQALGALDDGVRLDLEDGDQWRMVAQYYAAVGYAKRHLAALAAVRQDRVGARALYDEAQAQFQKCVQVQDDHMREDQTLKEDIIDGSCRPGLALVAQGLAALGG